jgi:hypothetical protein
LEIFPAEPKDDKDKWETKADREERR